MVAMESTGIYWIPIYEILETRGSEAYLVMRVILRITGNDIECDRDPPFR